VKRGAEAKHLCKQALDRNLEKVRRMGRLMPTKRKMETTNVKMKSRTKSGKVRDGGAESVNLVNLGQSGELGADEALLALPL